MIANNLNQKIINTIRTLSMDAIQKANSGHPGAPMGLAPVGWTLYNEIMNFNPQNPAWVNRDRFVLSAGHASMLQYSLLHLTGYDLSLDDIKEFRQFESRCPGHPEVGVTAGVEVSTGPLGQGAATSVGIAMAETWLAKRYNKDNFNIVDFNTFTVMGDGCLMEGITSEAASLAGHFKLGKLVWIYDSNKISIEGSTDLTFTESVEDRFKSYGWQVLSVSDANDICAVQKALENAKAESQMPTLIIVKSHIAFGSPNLQDSENSHGAPLGEKEVALTKEALGMDPEAFFFVDDDVKAYTKEIVSRGQAKESKWNALFNDYKAKYPAEATEFEKLISGDLPDSWLSKLPTYGANEKGVAGRNVNGDLLNIVANEIPWFIGGSADLGPSNKSIINNEGWYQADNRSGRNIHFGVREHAMGAIANGLALTYLRSFCATFFVFADYMRSSIRLSALMELPVFYFFTHDSLFVGEDGPTHQPIEHLSTFRSMPGVDVVRPGDANELVALWQYFLKEAKRPVLFILSRQNMPTLGSDLLPDPSMATKGAYVVNDTDPNPELILITTGSELSLALQSQAKLATKGISTRVVSMPSWELFERQSNDYKTSVLPSSITKRMAIEAASSFGWAKYLLSNDPNAYVCIDDFATSAPDSVLAEKMGFNVDNVLKKALLFLGK